VPRVKRKINMFQRTKGDERMKELETAHILTGNGYRIYIQILTVTTHALSTHNETKFTLERRETFERRESIVKGFARC
jgi:hypothetical protein